MSKSTRVRQFIDGTAPWRCAVLVGAVLGVAGPALAGEAGLDAPPAGAAPIVETVPAPVSAVVSSAEVLGASGIDMRAMRQHLAQTLGPDSERDSQRFRYDMLGHSGQITAVRRSAFGTIYAAGSPHNSGSFDRDVVVGGVGLLNVAWAGLKRGLKN